MTTPLRKRRSGAVLVLVLLLLVILDCILVGTLQLARQQRRLADNRTELLALQLAADGAVRRALGEWPQALTSTGAARADSGPGLAIVTRFEPLEDGLVLVSASAYRQGAPFRAAAAQLAQPPALAPDADVASAALTAATATLRGGSIVTAGPVGPCDPVAPVAARVAAAAPTLEPGAVLAGILIVQADATPILDGASFDHRRGTPGLVIATSDTVIRGSFTGILLADASVSLADNVDFRGWLLTRGALTIEAGAVIRGSAQVGGHADVRGRIERDACMVEAAIRAAGLRIARPRADRAWIPSFSSP